MPQRPSDMATSRINIPASPAYVLWLEEMAEGTGMAKAVLLDQAIRAFAAERGFPPPPPRRLPIGRRRRVSPASEPQA